MKLKKFIFSLSIGIVVCFKSLTLIFIGKSILVLAIVLVTDYFKTRGHRGDIEELKVEVLKSRSLIINDFRHHIDIEDINLTASEYDLLEYMCIHSATNKELCSYFGKSLSTVKNQLRSIMDKAGVDNRYDLISLCSQNFI